MEIGRNKEVNGNWQKETSYTGNVRIKQGNKNMPEELN
jgi:hypothetical protein